MHAQADGAVGPLWCQLGIDDEVLCLKGRVFKRNVEERFLDFLHYVGHVISCDQVVHAAVPTIVRFANAP